MRKKKDFTPEQINQMWDMINRQKKSIAQVAKHFNVNKPSISKALGAWNTDQVDLENGAKGRWSRGRFRIDYVEQTEETTEEEQSNANGTQL